MPLDEELSIEEQARALGQRLAARALAPARPRLVECLVKLTGAPERVCREGSYSTGKDDPLRWILGRHYATGQRTFDGVQGAAEAWEMLAPGEWLDEQDRAFLWRDGSLGARPETVREALLLACDPAALTTAEALAREVSLRAAPALAVGPTRVAWRVVESRRFRAGFFSAPSREAPSPCARVMAHLVDTSGGLVPAAERPEVAASVRRETVKRLGGCGWDLGLLVEAALRARGAGRSDPFGPLLELWQTGFALDAIRGDAVVLAAPAFVG